MKKALESFLLEISIIVTQSMVLLEESILMTFNDKSICLKNAIYQAHVFTLMYSLYICN